MHPPQQLPSAWSVAATTHVADCRVFSVHRHRMIRQRDAVEGNFYVIHAPDWVMALPITADKQIVLVRQFRYGTEDFSWEVPGGIVDPGEDPVTTAVRELREETGYAGNNPQRIGTRSPNPSTLNNRCHFVRIDGCRPLHAHSPDEHEELEVATVSIPTAREWARTGKIHHVMAITALFLLEDA